jgi:hypothetical protein
MKCNPEFTITRSAITLFLLLVSLGIFAQENKMNVLFVGNSYTYNSNLPQITALISQSSGTELITKRSVKGGAYLWEHWNGKRGLETKRIIAEGDFDIVILQDNSMATLQVPDSTLKSIEKFTEFNRKHGAETFLFNTWAREKVPQAQAEIDEIYEMAASESGATRVPVGSAFQLAKKYRPTIDLYTSDGSHPTQLGTYLAAIMFVKAITGEIPEMLPKEYNIRDEHGEEVVLLWVDPLDADFCRRIAEEIYE